MKNIAFVDDEKGILDGLRRMLRSHRGEWDMHFYLSGNEALAGFSENNFDVVISDMRMPEMNGSELLQHIRESSPGTLRVVLSGYANDEMILESVGAAHQFISKPADQNEIVKTIERALCLQEELNVENAKQVLGSVDSLPALPEIYGELMRELASDDASIDSVGEIVERDMSLSSNLLRLVNSAFFGLVRHIESPAQAAAVLGLEAVKNLALSTSVFSSFQGGSESLKDIESLNGLAQKVGVLTGKMAKVCTLSRRAKDHAQIAGMMINLGSLIAKVFAGQINTSSEDADNYPLLGSYLLGIWSMPFPVVEAVRWYRQPRLSNIDVISPMAIVHASWAMLTLCLEQGEIDLKADLLDVDYLDNVAGRDMVEEWKSITEEFCNANS